MGRIARRLGIVATSVIACTGMMAVAAPVAEAKTVSTTVWAKGFCNAVQDWQVRVDTARGLVEDVVTNGVPTSAVSTTSQKKIVSALDAAGKGSAAAAKALRSLGAPDVADGPKISTAISTAVGNTAQVFFDARSAVAKAPTAAAKYQARMKAISAKIVRDYTKAGKDVDGIEALAAGGELDTALTAEPTCATGGE
jgi:hypothetical protein